MVYRFLLSLFSTPQEAEAIEGDLLEEGASTSARARSLVHLAIAPFRDAPWTMAGLGILGLATTWPLSWITRQAAQALVLNVPVYHYIAATTFWQLSTVPPFILMGFLIAWLTGRRAMSVAIAVVLLIATMVCVVDPMMVLMFGPARLQQQSVWFWVSRALYAIGTWGGVVLVSTALGIALRRSASRPLQKSSS